MKHLREIQPIREKKVWATIGAFDGVHRGHQQIIQTMVKAARSADAAPAVISFYPHPAVLLRGLPMPFYLTGPEEKARIFEALSVDYTITLTFTRELANRSPNEFMQMLTDSMPLEKLWLGADFALGKDRAGTLPVLQSIGEESGFEVVEFPHLMLGEEKISSSRIRKQIQSGELKAANQALGYTYNVIGKVIHGDARGRTIGFPTANIELWEGKIMPPAGVYATWAFLNGEPHKSVSNIGYRPTFSNDRTGQTLETYIIDFDRPIYGENLKLAFVEKLRPEMRYGSVNELVRQIQKDVQNTEEILSNAPQTNGLLT